MRTLWILDTSLSMVTQDIQGDQKIYLSRFDAAKRIILSGTTDSHGEEALLTFDDVARIQLPFSSDRDTFSSVVRSIEPVLYGGATDIDTALSSVALIYPHEQVHVVLLTDGENSGTGGTLPDLPVGMNLSVVGIGTTEGGPMLQGYNADGKPRYKQYAGKDAISQLDRTHLSAITSKYNGKYYEIANIRDIENIVSEIGVNTGKQPFESSSWLLYSGILFFLVALFVKPYKMVDKKTKTKNKV